MGVGDARVLDERVVKLGLVVGEHVAGAVDAEAADAQAIAGAEARAKRLLTIGIDGGLQGALLLHFKGVEGAAAAGGFKLAGLEGVPGGQGAEVRGQLAVGEEAEVRLERHVLDAAGYTTPAVTSRSGANPIVEIREDGRDVAEEARVEDVVPADGGCGVAPVEAKVAA